MNKRDKDYIAYLLAFSEDLDSFREGLFAYDDSMELDYEGYDELVKQNERINDLFNKKMTDKYGNGWCLVKASKADSKRFYKEAEQEIRALEDGE